MIRIGFGPRQRQEIMNDYIINNDIEQAVILNTKQHPKKYKLTVDTEYVEYDEWEMYRTFYPLIEKIDSKTLVVVDEPYRTSNFQDLKYNCATVFLNQTEHRIVFSTFPIIENKDDFRILMKFEKASKHVDKFDYKLLHTEDILIKPQKIKMNTMFIETTKKQKERYKKKTDSLFDNLGRKDPDTIPRNLQIYAGNMKKKMIKNDKMYIARNKRFKFDNVHSYNDYENRKDYIVIDTHYNRVPFIDFLIDTKIRNVKYLATDLSIDNYIVNDFAKWRARIDSIYAKANLSK